MDLRPEVLLVLLDEVPGGGFDDVARQLAAGAAAPIALVTVLDDRDQRFAGMHGLGGTRPGSDRGTPLAQSLCRLVADAGRTLVVHDGRHDPRLADHPAITRLGLRAYLGEPLRLADGSRIGAVCVADVRPRRWTTAEATAVRHARDVTERRIAAREGARTEA